MKTFLAARGKPLDKPTAWACTVTNLLVLPGLGSLAGGRKVGYAQAGLALAGFGGSIVWLIATVAKWLERGELPTEIGWLLMGGLGSIGLFAVAWLWALKTSLGFHQEAARARPPRVPASEPPRVVAAKPPALPGD